MPKRVKAGRNWEGDFIPAREQTKYYFEHDDRVGANTRRVSFKSNSSRASYKKGRRDWDKVLRMQMIDDDVDMGGAGASGFSGKIPPRIGDVPVDVRGGNWSGRRNRGRNSPMLVAAKKKLNSFPTNWFRVIIPYGSKYPKEYVIKALQIYIAPQPLIPYAYRVMGNEASFCIDDAKTAEDLLNADRKITATDGYKLLVKVRQGFPYFDITDTLKSRIKTVMGKRYNSATKALDLTNFHNDADLKKEELLVPLARSNIMGVVLDIIADNIPELVALNLGNNRIYSLESLSSLHKKAPHITVLHLAKNRIRDLRSLESVKALAIDDLVLEGNPLCKKFRDQSVYVSEVRKWLPKIVKLDGVELPPPIVFEATEKTKKPPSRGAFMCMDEGSHIVKQFIEQYYQLYDSDNRQGLVDAYHDNAMFSMSAATPIGVSAQYSANRDRLTTYITESRNLLRVSSERRFKMLYVGRTNIVNFLATLPKTQHDPVSFTVDLTFFTPQLMNVVVTGVFREPNNKGAMPRAFARTFVIVPFGTGYCIVNEQLFITLATPNQAKVAFQTPVAVPNPQPVVVGSPVAVPGAVDEVAMQQMIEALATQTGMNLLWSKKCLEESSWDFQKAVGVFTVLHKQGTVPAEAFVK